MVPAEYRYDPSHAKLARWVLLGLAAFFIVLSAFAIVSIPEASGILAAALALLFAMIVFGIVLTTRRIAYRKVVLSLDESALRFSPVGQNPVVIPWNRVVLVRQLEAKGDVVVGVDYHDARGREREVTINLSLLDCEDPAGVAAVIASLAAHFADPPTRPARSLRRADAVRRGLFWFGMLTCVLPVSCTLVEVLLDRLYYHRPRGPDGPMSQLMKTDFAPVMWTLMILGCLAMIFWAWLLARRAAQAARERGGKLSTSARWIAGVCSVGAILGSVSIWWQMGNRFGFEEWRVIGGFGFGGGVLGLIYCVWGGRNPDVPEP